MVIEKVRGCGYRKVDGLYLMGTGIASMHKDSKIRKIRRQSGSLHVSPRPKGVAYNGRQ